METAALAVAPARGGFLVQPRAAFPYGGAAQGPRRGVGAGLAAPGRRRALVAARPALPERLEPLSLAQEGTVVVAHEADEEVNGDVDSAQISSPSGVREKTVRVRFVLKKQCPFGQSLHLVGDDLALGLWDPSKAVVLDWSEGHYWTAEKDLPANRLIEFKFLLQDLSGKLQWQIGPNRSIQTGETGNTLVVYEDWGNVKNQKIEEEGNVSVGMVETVVPDDSETRNGVVLPIEATRNVVVLPVEATRNCVVLPVEAVELQVNDNQEARQDESSVGDDAKEPTVATSSSVQGESVKSDEVEQPEIIVVDELKIEEVLHEKSNTGPENGSVAKCADDSYPESTDEDSILSEDGVPVENRWTGAFEHELLWGWKALQQLLMSLGFKMGTS